jgi:hypothetical protein
MNIERRRQPIAQILGAMAIAVVLLSGCGGSTQSASSASDAGSVAAVTPPVSTGPDPTTGTGSTPIASTPGASSPVAPTPLNSAPVASTPVTSTSSSSGSSSGATTGSSSSSSGGGTVAARSNDFISIVGVNGHVQSYSAGAAYTTVPSVVKDAQYIGATRWRDGSNSATAGAQLSTMQALANAGIKFTIFPTITGNSNPYTFNLDSTLSAVKTIDGLTAGGDLSDVEMFNEPYNWGVTYNGVAGGGGKPFNAVASADAAYYAAIKADSTVGNLPVWSVTEVGAQTPNVGLQFLIVPSGAGTTSPDGTQFADVYNSHIYPYYNGAVGFIDPNPNVYNGGHDQFLFQMSGDFVTTYQYGYAGEPLSTVLASPRVITEFGLSTSGQVDAVTKAKNLANAYLIAYADGFEAAYCYELYDEGDGYGLFTGSGSPTVAATYIHNLNAVLMDSGSNAATFAPGSLPLRVTGLPSTGMSLLFQQSNGTFQLVLWRNETNYNITSQSDISIAPKNVTVTLASGTANFAVYDVTAGTSPTNTSNGATSIVVPVADYPMIVNISNT